MRLFSKVNRLLSLQFWGRNSWRRHTWHALASRDAYAEWEKPIKKYISRWDVCFTHCNGQEKEQILQHEFTARHWAKVKISVSLTTGYCWLSVTTTVTILRYLTWTTLLPALWSKSRKRYLQDLVYLTPLSQITVCTFPPLSLLYLQGHAFSSRSHHHQLILSETERLRMQSISLRTCSESGRHLWCPSFSNY